MASNDERYTGAPVHPLSAILTIVLDYLWTPEEAGAAITIVGLAAEPFLIMTVAAAAFVGVLLVQKFIAHDSLGKSAAKAFVMGVIAGVPFPVTSTAAGGVLLTWAGISYLGSRKQLTSGTDQKRLGSGSDDSNPGS